MDCPQGGSELHRESDISRGGQEGSPKSSATPHSLRKNDPAYSVLCVYITVIAKSTCRVLGLGTAFTSSVFMPMLNESHRTHRPPQVHATLRSWLVG